MMKKTIAVLGSTGQQGGAVARACLKAGWNVRGITRNVNGKSAKALEAEGAEMVSADVDDLESLVKAFEGVHAAFCLTNFWEHLSTGIPAHSAGQKEAIQAFNVALAASKTSTLEHYLFSTLPNATQLTNGEAPVPHMDHKAGVDDRIRSELPALAAKTTFVWMAWYSANMVFFPPVKPFEAPGTGGKWVWAQPSRGDALLPVAGDVNNNLGVFAVAALSHPDVVHGKYIDVRSDLLSFTDILKIWSEVTGKEAVYVNIDSEAYGKIWGAAGVEMAMQYQSGEQWGDWERLKQKDMVQPQEIGIKKNQLVDLRGHLEGMKGALLG